MRDVEVSADRWDGDGMELGMEVGWRLEMVGDGRR